MPSKYADFTPEENKRLGSKIEKLVGEGMPQDQAVAVAIKMLFPGRSRSEKAAAVDASGVKAPGIAPARKKDGVEAASAPQGEWEEVLTDRTSRNTLVIPLVKGQDGSLRINPSDRPRFVWDGEWLDAETGDPAPQVRKRRYSVLPGGAYRAEQAADGSWTVRDIPIFVEHEVPLANGKDTARVDRAWLQAAVEKAAERERGDKYLAPVHVRHHGGPQPTEPAGFVRPTRVGEMSYEGRRLAVLFADLVGVPDATYREMRAGRLPYRSVEVHDVSKPEVNSLALLQDEVPFFRLPMLTIGAERPVRVTSVSACARYAPLEAFAECESMPARAFMYSEAGMRSYAVVGIREYGRKAGREAARQASPGTEFALSDEPLPGDRNWLKSQLGRNPTREESAEFVSGWEDGWNDVKGTRKGSAMPDDDKNKRPEGAEAKLAAPSDDRWLHLLIESARDAEPHGGEDIPSDAIRFARKALAGDRAAREKAWEIWQEISDAFEGKATKMTNNEEEKREEGAEVKAEAEPNEEEEVKLDRLLAMLTKLCEKICGPEFAAPAEAPAAGTPATLSSAASPAALKLAAAADAKATALAGRVKALEAEREVERLVKLGLAETRGLSVGDDVEANVRKYAAKGGEEAVRIYLDAVKAHAPKDPPDKGDAPAAPPDPVVAAYQAQGPDAVARAARYSAEWEAQANRTTMTRDRFVAARFDADAMAAPRNGSK